MRSATCPKNPKKFLFMHYEGEHEIPEIRVSPWAFNMWQVDSECVLCGDHFKRFGLNPSELYRMGVEPTAGIYDFVRKDEYKLRD